MATKFTAMGLVSIRANQLVRGEVYTMAFFSKSKEPKKVQFAGFWNGEGNREKNPKVLKNMPQDWTMRIFVPDDHGNDMLVHVTKDPAGHGAMFIGKDRVTFGGEPEQVERFKALQAQDKA